MNDTIVAQLIAGEEARQHEGLELIPSENYVSDDVLKALGSVFTNKYSEGYPGRRYYGGQQYTDQVEQLAIDRAKQLLALTTQMCSRTAAHLRMKQYIARGGSQAIRFWRWT